ncbi:Dabb family protein [Flavobacterium glaciei]|uniref:Stress responsive alpha/beta barrel protein n=1 Tax=Flavobacterium glaciei TaxID=386300 RepID=A0A562PXK4_9FLAO|nr:Dabb family protein [Flavobacterium glaciei]RDI56611.1 stress responsive alpha/beta barrel protein [Flavobacterium glaciei]TWI49181.1 stress responsive alpha/beta barrel protein [Flavobacterium glaciei]
MKKLLLLTFILISSYTVNAQQNKQKQLLRHVVMFGWKPVTDAAAIDKVVTAFGSLEHKIKLIKAYEWGINNSPENLNNGLTHCFVLTFKSEADRDAYLIHPDHKAFVAVLSPAPDKVTVVDYWTNK